MANRKGLGVDVHQPVSRRAELCRAADLAASLLARSPELNIESRYRTLLCKSSAPVPSLLLDDFSSLLLPGIFKKSVSLQERVRLRANPGDFVASAYPRVQGYEDYCKEKLGLGSVCWLYPQSSDPQYLARSCRRDAAIHRRLVGAMRSERIRRIHPFMGSRDVWELARWLRVRARRPLTVMAPPPGLTEYVNNKIAFAEIVNAMFGRHHIPASLTAASLDGVVKCVTALAALHDYVVVKLPNSAGGGGNLLIETEPLRRNPVSATRRYLQDGLAKLDWTGLRPTELLISAWEENVCHSPSVQLWIPPEEEEFPVVQGIFLQELRGGEFSGSTPARLPGDVSQELTDRCWLLAYLFQKLGYRGRCSFDTLLVGSTASQSRVVFVECNGRWGGTSIPMDFVSRLFGSRKRQRYVTRTFWHRRVRQVDFPTILELFEPDLFDARKGTGRLILYNPIRMSLKSEISVIVLGTSLSDARNWADEELPSRLDVLLGPCRPTTRTGS